MVDELMNELTCKRTRLPRCPGTDLQIHLPSWAGDSRCMGQNNKTQPISPYHWNAFHSKRFFPNILPGISNKWPLFGTSPGSHFPEALTLWYTHTRTHFQSLCPLCGPDHRSHPAQGVKEFKCEVCGREFTLQANMKRHMLIHTSVRPYQCHICFKTFVQKQTLKTHMIVHSPVKPFKCKVPGLRAPRWDFPTSGLSMTAAAGTRYGQGSPGWVKLPGLWGLGWAVRVQVLQATEVVF